MSDSILLIHGAWQGAWVWDAFAPCLRAAGLNVVSVDLPGNGVDATRPQDVSLQRYVDHVAAIAERCPGKVSLIGHSGGGITASQVAEELPERVARICYVAGMMLPDGMSFGNLVAEMKAVAPEVVGVGAMLEWSPDRLTSSVPVDAALKHFFNGCPHDGSVAAAMRLTPQPEGGRAIAPRLTPGRFGRIPRLYIEATDDRSVLPLMQRRMCELVPGAAVAAIPTCHAPHFAAPHVLAGLVLPFLKS